MVRRVRSLGAVLLLALVSAVVIATPRAYAASWFEQNFYLSGPRYDGQVPACETGLDTITSRFAEKESRFWSSDLNILGFERVREVAYRPWAPNAIPRRYCSALALLSDGLRHPVYFSIGEDTGYAGTTWGVEWCVVGTDRNWAYNPNCKMARP